MNGAKPCRSICIVLSLAATCLFTSCQPSASNQLQGYIEGEFVYVAAPLAGRLEKLSLERGAQVQKGDLLFELENVREKSARDEAERHLAEARAKWRDAQKGLRPSEVESIEAQQAQARASAALSEKEFARQEQLVRAGASSSQDLDRARAINDQNRQRLAQLEAELKTAQLGARTDLVSAAEAHVRAMEAALAKAEWELSQKRQVAPQTGLAFDTLYEPGEWVAAGRPVVVLLPPQNIKLRAFVPETRIAAIHLGDSVRVSVDGVAESFLAKVSFISPRAEFTPPVIYSRESRGKLVFMIEAVFDPKVAAKLHPGQPVDVSF